MKKTINVSIGQRSFIINEDAYLRLEAYLSDFARELNGAYGSDEVMEDLEMRIAELFSAESAGGASVVDLPVVERVIGQLGMPNGAYAGSGNSTAGSSTRTFTMPRKRLYRNPDDKMLFGICGGLGAYLNVDPVVIRIVFVILLLCGTTGFWLYIILLILVPMAITPVQKCEMMGLEPTVENLRRFTKFTKS